MSAILFTPDADELRQSDIIRTIYDPACGTGGMVNVGKRYILEEICANSEAKPTIKTYGQELNEQSYAIANSEALVSGEDATTFALATLSQKTALQASALTISWPIRIRRYLEKRSGDHR